MCVMGALQHDFNFVPLHEAVSDGHLAIVEYLIEQAGADVCAKDKVTHNALNQHTHRQ